MKSVRSKNFLVIRLDEGEEVISSITACLQSEGIRSGVVPSFIGALKHCRLILSKGIERNIPDHTEAVGNGNVSWFNNAPFIHLHVSVGNDHGAWVGHLLGGVVDVFCEAVVMPLDAGLSRHYSRELADTGVTVPFVLELG